MRAIKIKILSFEPSQVKCGSYVKNERGTHANQSILAIGLLIHNYSFFSSDFAYLRRKKFVKIGNSRYPLKLAFANLCINAKGGGNVSSRHMIYQQFYFGYYSLGFRDNWVKSF